MCGRYKTIILTLLLATSQMSIAADLGVIGQVYPIQEEDFLQFIHNRLDEMQKNGQLGKLQHQFQSNVERHVIRPHPFRHLARAIQDRSWNYDPSITAQHDLKDHDGRIFAKAGSIVNPLQTVTIHSALLFFDGDDKEQVAWAVKINHDRQNKTKLVLVNGGVQEQENRFHRPIYFDQAGTLTTRFHIAHVPAMVIQEDTHLKISEVVP